MSHKKYFLVFLFAVFCCFTADTSIVDLSSSFNVDDGAGTTSLAICYGVSILAALPTPAIGYKIGCKSLLILGQVGYLIYILCNTYSSFATLVPGGFFMGIGEAWVWTAIPIITTYFAKQQLGKRESFESKIRKYTAYYLAVIEMSTVAGSGISFVVLYIDRQHSPTSAHNASVAQTPRDLSVCGANDCQDPNITQMNEEQYHPLNIATRYAFIAIIACLSVLAMVLYYFSIPDKVAWDLESEPSVGRSESELSEKLVDCEMPATQLSGCSSHSSRSDLDCGEKRENDENVDTAGLAVEVVPRKRLSLRSLLVQPMIDTFWLAVSRKHLLIFPLTIYNGTTASLLFGELTRSLSSCILGVDRVGLCMMIYGITTSVSCVAVGRFAARYGRNIPLLVGAAVDVASYLFCLTWTITEANAWMTYVIFGAFGVSLAIWNTLVIALYGEYFMDEHELAYNLWNIVMSTGLMWQFAVSTYFCVYVKIYMQFALLGGGLIAYFISQALYYPQEFRLVYSDKRKMKAQQESVG